MRSIGCLWFILICCNCWDSIFAAEIFTASPVEIQQVSSSLLIHHEDRLQSGGLSSLWISPDCETLLTISDYSQVPEQYIEEPIKRSSWFQAKLNYTEDNRLQGLTVTDQGQLHDTDGQVLQGAVESIAWNGNGFYISFDDRGNIYHYAGSSPEGKLLSGTPTIPINQNNFGTGDEGLESITLMNDGSLFTLWQRLPGTKVAKGVVFSKSGAAHHFRYVADSDPSGATTLGDGSVLVLESDFLNKAFRLVKLSPGFIEGKEKDELIKGKTIFDQYPDSVIYDNYEGISACKRNGKQWVFVITDNNGDWSDEYATRTLGGRQRTLLLMIDYESLGALWE